MKRILLGVIGCMFVLGCSVDSTDESLGEGEQPLDVTKTSGLTAKQGPISGLSGPTSEVQRRADTQSYYDHVTIDGTNTISAALPTLGAFTAKYAFTAASETVAYYYNRGDLGIGREMHCVDRLASSPSVIACYVKNFAADNAVNSIPTEFTFGLSSNIAFSNMAAHSQFATVAMVFRNGVTGPNNVFFVVYDAKDVIQPFAALDRTGQLAFNEFKATGQNVTSVPGVNYNNHAPTNCISCHGGVYNVPAGSPSVLNPPTVTGALFLPFDLDQFDFSDVVGQTRSAQLPQFKQLNAEVWRVAALSGSDSSTVRLDPNVALASPYTPVRNQLNRWYKNTVLAPNPANEVFENDFDSSPVTNPGVIPTGWGSAPFGSSQGQQLYTAVVRGSCRNCHVANMSIPFETEAQFFSNVGSAVFDLKRFYMPHSVQTVRQFWQSAQSGAFASYLSAKGDTADLGTLNAAGPGNVATLDPPQITASILH